MNLTRNRHALGRAVLVVAIAAAASLVKASSAYAIDLKVYSPNVEKGEFGIESRGNVTVDNASGKSGEVNQKHELEYSPTERWHTALVGEFEREPSGDLNFTATAWENIFQLTEQGKHWLDLGLYLELEGASRNGEPNAFEWKALLEKNVGAFTLTVNPIFEKEIGHNAEKSLEFMYASRLKWRMKRQFEPAIEMYGEVGELKNPDPVSEQRHQIGPVILGAFDLGQAKELKYEVGYLFGLTDQGSPDGDFKWLLEYEMHF